MQPNCIKAGNASQNAALRKGPCLLRGGLCGLLFGRRVSEGMRETLMAATGAAVLFLGAGGALSYMLTVEGDGLSTRGTMLMIASLA